MDKNWIECLREKTCYLVFSFRRAGLDPFATWYAVRRSEILFVLRFVAIRCRAKQPSWRDRIRGRRRSAFAREEEQSAILGAVVPEPWRRRQTARGPHADRARHLHRVHHRSQPENRGCL